MKKIIKKTLTGILVLYILTILFPQFLFANKLEHSNFTVYYHSDKIDIDEIKKVIDKSTELIKESEIYESSINQKLFVTNNYLEFSYFSPLSRNSFAVNYPITQNIFLTKSSFLNNKIERNGKSNNVRSLSSVIAHETTHSLLENKLGFLKNKRLEHWKTEGYCDFIAKESSFDESEGFEIFCNNDKNDSYSYNYFKYRLYTEYILTDLKVGLDSFLTDDFDTENLNNQIKNKYCTQQ